MYNTLTPKWYLFHPNSRQFPAKSQTPNPCRTVPFHAIFSRVLSSFRPIPQGSGSVSMVGPHTAASSTAGGSMGKVLVRLFGKSV